jgi:hypothetical protein
MVSLQNFLQLEDFNGVPLAAGKVYVYHQGRTELAEIYSDINGETPIANPAVLDDLGMQNIYVSNVYNYTVVVTDPYNNELFTREIYPNGVDGDGNNRLYEGIDPIVVNNDKMAISAKKATLSVQDPLYFVEDSQSAVCIGLQESAYSGLPYIENSAIELDPSGNISGISGHTFHSKTTESASIVTSGWETGSDGRITAYNGTAFSAGKVYSGISPVYVDNENDQIGVSSKDFLANSPLYFTEYFDRVELSISGLPPTPGLMYESGFNYESGKITGYNGSGISAGKVYTGISPVTVDNDNDTISVASAILGVQAPLYFVEDSESATVIGLNTAQIQIDIPESANWEDAYSTVNNNSGDWQSAADELAVLNTAKWEGAADTLSSHSADWNSVNDKLDKSALELTGEYVSGIELSGTSYRLYAGWSTEASIAQTANFDSEGNYIVEYVNAIKNSSGDWNNVSAKLDSTASANFLTTGDSSNFYTTANESGFITGVDLTDYATKDFVNDNVASSISGKLDIATYSSESGNFLTAVPADYATTAWVTGQGYLTAETDWTNTITAASAYAYSEATAQIPTDYATTAQLADKLDTAIYANDSGTFLTAHQSLTASANWNSTYDTVSNNSASWTGGATPTYEYTDNGLISAIDSSGLYAESSTSALIAVSTNHLNNNGTMGGNIIQSKDSNNFYYMPLTSPFGKPTGIFSPLQYATGACLAMAGGGYAAYFKGNEWYVSNTGIGQALRGEVHNSRSVHISGATTAGYGFDLNIKAVSGVNSTGSWKYGHAEDAALRAVSSCDMHESAFGYDASNNITAYNGSAFKAGDEFPQSATEAIEVVTGGSANWNSTTATVATNSGAWGGQGIELSAGFGIDIQLVDNKLVISLATATGDI